MVQTMCVCTHVCVSVCLNNLVNDFISFYTNNHQTPSRQTDDKQQERYSFMRLHIEFLRFLAYLGNNTEFAKNVNLQAKLQILIQQDWDRT